MACTCCHSVSRLRRSLWLLPTHLSILATLKAPPTHHTLSLASHLVHIVHMHIYIYMHTPAGPSWRGSPPAAPPKRTWRCARWSRSTTTAAPMAGTSSRARAMNPDPMYPGPYATNPALITHRFTLHAPTTGIRSSSRTRRGTRTSRARRCATCAHTRCAALYLPTSAHVHVPYFKLSSQHPPHTHMHMHINIHAHAHRHHPDSPQHL